MTTRLKNYNSDTVQPAVFPLGVEGRKWPKEPHMLYNTPFQNHVMEVDRYRKTSYENTEDRYKVDPKLPIGGGIIPGYDLIRDHVAINIFNPSMLSAYDLKDRGRGIQTNSIYFNKKSLHDTLQQNDVSDQLFGHSDDIHIQPFYRGYGDKLVEKDSHIFLPDLYTDKISTSNGMTSREHRIKTMKLSRQEENSLLKNKLHY